MSAAIMASLILWLISPVLGNTLRYIILALVLVLLFAVAVDCQTPTHKLFLLDRAIQVARDTLKRALAECLRNRIELESLSDSLTHVEISVCDIRTQLLNINTLKTWKEYFQTVREILNSMAKYAKKVEEIRVSVLCIVEAERKYKLQRTSEETRAIIDGNNPWSAPGHVQGDALQRRHALAAPDALPVFFST